MEQEQSTTAIQLIQLVRYKYFQGEVTNIFTAASEKLSRYES